MQNITTYLSKSDIKPELAIIYVNEINGVKYAVATDSFRLVELKLPDLLQEHMPTGYYTAKAWIEITKAYNKKTMDIRTIMDTINAQNALQERYKDYNYPEYRQIYPKAETLTAFDGTFTINKNYFVDMLDLIPVNKFDHLDLTQIKQNKNMIVYTDDTITLLLMQVNK